MSPGTPFESDGTWCKTNGRFLERLAGGMEVGESLRGLGLVVRFACRDPRAELSLDLRQPTEGAGRPFGYACGPLAGQPDLTIGGGQAELNRFWLGELRLLDAAADGRLTVEGPLVQALLLEGRLQPVFAAYRDHLQAAGRSDPSGMWAQRSETTEGGTTCD